MQPERPITPAGPLPALIRVSREVALEASPAEAVWKLVTALREDLGVDRAGVAGGVRQFKM